VGGAVLFQAFVHSPGSARIHGMFKPAETVRRAAREVARTDDLPVDWIRTAVHAAASLRGLEPTYLELPCVRVFSPLPEYVLAVKCGAMMLADAFQEMEDVRYVLRAMDLPSADAALATVTRYIPARQLDPSVRPALLSLLGV
jgi:hypothetical protein